MEDCGAGGGGRKGARCISPVRERGVLAQLSCQEMFNNIVQIVEWQALYTLIRLLLRSNLIRVYNAFSGSSDAILSFLLICMHVVL